ncbi:MAG TPA: MerR family transcriptional regulator [Anaerolineaceae bacterium]|nr:MerR family transcriptional regulator [Anaerolineaceae bacterium]HPN51319.1 MerR family transcriptional regulator [Anaerolineaceae bacterium]
MEETTYTIQELMDLTGLPRRTIHFYTQQGILPPPQGAGLGARYGEAHLLRLQAMPVLRAQGMRLDEIREAFAQSPLDEIRRVARDAPPIAAAQPALNPAGELRLHYPLPGGLELVAPANASPELQARVSRLLEAARQICSDERPVLKA